MKTAYNPSTGEVLGFSGGQWVPLKTASNQSGETLYLGEEGWMPLDTKRAATPDTPKGEEEPSFVERAGRSLGLGTRNVLEGLGRGASLGLADPGGVISDMLDLPRAETRGERARGAFIEGASGAIPTLGAGAALTSAKAIPAVAEVLSAAPVLQTVSEGTAGLAAETARESGAGGTGQLVAAILGGMAPSVGATAGKAAKLGIRSLGGSANLLTKGGQEKIAGQTLRRVLDDPESTQEAIEAYLKQGELVPGSFPTTAEVVGKRGLARLEKTLSKVPGEERFGKLEDERFKARQEALYPVREEALSREVMRREGVGREAGEMVSPERQGMTSEDYGKDIRGTYGKKYEAQRDLTRDVYRAVDPEGKAAFSLSPLRDSLTEALDVGRYDELPSGVARIMNRIDEDIVNGRPASFKDLQGLRSTFSDMAQSASVQGDMVTARIANRLKNATDNFLNVEAMSPDMQGTAIRPAPGSKGYGEATKIATESVATDPHFENLKYMMERGINRDAIESVIGTEGVRELNKLAPGIIRKDGALNYDEIAGELGYTPDYLPSSGQDLLESLQNRLSGDRGRYRQAVDVAREQALDDMTTQHRGFSETDKALYSWAKQERALQGKRFEEGYNLPLSRKGKVRGESGIRDEAVPSNYFRPGPAGGAAMRDFKQWADEGDMSIMKDYAVSELLSKAGKPDGTLDTKKWRSWMDSHANALQQFPALRKQLDNIANAQDSVDRLSAVTRETLPIRTTREGEYIDLTKKTIDAERLLNAGYSKKHVDTLQRVQEDIRRGARKERFQRERGSDTFSNFSTAEALAKAITGGMSESMLKNNAARAVANATARFMSRFGMTNPEEAVKELLTQAALDPSVANALLRKATPERVESLWKKVGESIMKDRGTMKDVGRALFVTTGKSGMKTSDERKK